MFCLALFLAAITAPAAPAQNASGRVHGVVSDGSGGVLPGVTVVAGAADGRVLGTTVTDEAGRFAFRVLPVATVRLTFQLEGFSAAVVDVVVAAGVDSLVPAQRLGLASRSETVEVHGMTRIDPAAPAPSRVMPAPRPRPVVTAVPDHDKDSVCGPSKPDATADSFGTIRSRRAAGNGLYAADDELIIDGGTANGLAIGQNVVARRAYRTSVDRDGVAGEHTAGVLQIVAAEPSTAVAVVVYACDEMMPGDWLAPFTPEPVRTPEPPGQPAYDLAARIVLTDAGQLLGAPRRMMVIDRGRDHGIRVGQRLTLFRDRAGGRGPAVLGDAVVVAVHSDSATIRVQHATDVIAVGDSAAPQR